MARILCNFDVASLYPTLVRIFGYSSRNQKDKNKYIETLDMRLDAKYKRTAQEILDSLAVTYDDLNKGLKLPINAYTGALRATFNALYDPLQGFSICTTGQLLILQLIYDLQQIPTLEMVSANTDAVMFTIEEDLKPKALEVLDAWQKHTGLELEEDKIVKIIMRDVNNYCEILEVKDGYKVNYKGGEFKGNHNFKWNKDKQTFEYSFEDDFETNSLTIISEAMLKNLLFDIPVEETIHKCDDIFRFQMITHLGHTYEKVVQEGIDYSDEIKQLTIEYERLTAEIENAQNSGSQLEQWYQSDKIKYQQQDLLKKINHLKNISGEDTELQRNNRIYAGKKPSGIIVKVKYDGRRDSLANCPPNPIVDNANHCTIDDVNKEWYIKIAKQKLSDFRGVKRLSEYKKTELVEMATNMGIEFDPKIKKDDLIKLIEENKERNEVMCMEEKILGPVEEVKPKSSLAKKINDIKEEIMKMDFVMDQVMPNNLGGGEYASIGQYYRTINELSIKYGLLFNWEVKYVDSFEKELFKPATGMPQHVVTVKCQAMFIDVEDGNYIEYETMASGSDTCDKAVSGASALAFRNWFDKNFTPKHLVVDEFTGLNSEVSESKEQTAPKVPTYIPPAKKEEITNKVVETVQHEKGDDEDIKEIIGKIMKVRELTTNPTWGAQTLENLMSGDLSSADIMGIGLKVDNKLESLGVE